MTAHSERERLSLLVHEVRSPTAALAAIAVALADDGLDEATTRHLLELAVAACRGIERIVGDAAVGSLQLEAVDVGDVVRDAATAAALDGPRIRAEIEAGLPPIRADAVRLRQALDNLVANALAHSPPGGEVVIGARTEGEAVLVTVSDEGLGVPENDRARIFEPGVRLEMDAPGLGLGLSVVRAIAEAHGGTVTVESTSGQGAVFTISLPAGSR